MCSLRSLDCFTPLELAGGWAWAHPAEIMWKIVYNLVLRCIRRLEKENKSFWREWFLEKFVQKKHLSKSALF